MTTTIPTLPTVTHLVATMKPDLDSDPYESRTRFHWERFGQIIDPDPESEYVSPFYGRHAFDFDDEDHPVYTLQRGARLVIDDSCRMSQDDKRPAAERLAELTQDARQIRTWLQDYWHYVGIIVTATVTTVVDGHPYTTTESESLWGIERGIGGLDPSYTYAQEHAYHESVVADLVSELRARLTDVVWPDDLATEWQDD